MTWTQVNVFLEEAGYVMFIRDLPMLNYHFSKLSQDDCTRIVAGAAQVDPIRAQAWEAFTARYGLQERVTAIAPDTAQEFLQALQAGRVPDWAVRIAPANEIASSAR